MTGSENAVHPCRPVVLALNMMDTARRRGIDIDVPELSRRLGLPVVETVAVKRGGAQALVERVDGALPAAAPVQADDAASRADLHAQVRELLAATVRMPRRTAELDDALDRWALHPVFGLAILALVMFLVFQAVYSLGKPMTDLIGDPAHAKTAARFREMLWDRMSELNDTFPASTWYRGRWVDENRIIVASARGRFPQ